MTTKDKNGRGRVVSNVYEILKRKMITLEIKPGEFLNEKRLMQELNVGRTPLRESILRLKVEGLVEGEPNKSSFVRDISLQGTKDLIEALLIVEKNIAYLAAQRATPHHIEEMKAIESQVEAAAEAQAVWDINTRNLEFHEALGRASGNKFLYQIHLNLRSQTQRLSYLALQYKAASTASLAEHYDRIIDQHRRMIEMVEARDTSGIEALCVAHIELFKQRILSYISETLYV